MEAKGELKLGTDDKGGGLGFATSGGGGGGGEVGVKRRFSVSACPATVSRSAVRLRTKDLVFFWSAPLSSVNSA